MIRKIIIITVWIILIAGLGVYMGFTVKQHQEVICNNLNILIKYNSNDYFLMEDDILKHFELNDVRVKGEALSAISTGDIENSLYTIPYIEKAQVYTSIEGDVEIRITQKKPLIKIYNKNNQCYYIDDKGGLLPGSPSYTARVLVGNGEIAQYYDPFLKLKQEDSLNPDTAIIQTALYKLYTLGCYIDKDPFWKAMVEEVYVNAKCELELYTKIGDAAIIFGDVEDMKEKFEKLFIFFKEGFSHIGWNKYKKINLKYKNQIVCSKT